MTAIAPDSSALRITRATTLEMVARGASDPLPSGVVGQVEGIALVYDVIDDRGTTFAKGCLTRTIAERVAFGKVKLYWDHGDAAATGTYDTHLHIGTVREVREDVGTAADGVDLIGKPLARFRADIFDTESGRKAHEYLRVIAATKSETGVSIGMMFLPETVRAVIDGQECERFREVPLREISITGESAVPGTHVTTVRMTLDTQPDTSTTGADAVAPLVLPSATINYEPLLRGIAAAIGADAFQLLTTGILSGDAEHRDSDGRDSNGRSTASAVLLSNDATTLDSQPAAISAARTDPLASTEARLAFVRAQFPRLYDP